MHRVIKKALTTFELESKLPPDQKKPALYWLHVFCGICFQQETDKLAQALDIMLLDRLLATIASWVKWKFNRREKDKKGGFGEWYGYSLNISVGSCPLCAVVRNHCSNCPLEIIGASCTLPSAPYNIATDSGIKTPLVNALWEAVEWAVKHEGESCAV